VSKEMRSYIIALIFVSVLIVGGTIGFFVTGFVTAGSVKKSTTFYYDPSSPDPIESLGIYSDLGEVSVQYNSSNTPHYATIDVNIEIGGLFMQGKSYTDFFTAESNWWNPTTAEFTLKVKPDIWFDPSYWFKLYNVTINVLLRTDIVYDLTATSSTGSVIMTTKSGVALNSTILDTSTGSVNLLSSTNVEFQGMVKLHTSTGLAILHALDNSTFLDSLALSTSTGSVDFNSQFTTFAKGFQLYSSTGSIDMEMTNCTIGDDIIAITSTGSVTLVSTDVIYTNDVNLHLETSTGSINANIIHHNDLNANITALFKTSTGSVNVNYRDYNTMDGFRFTSSTSTGSVNYTYLTAEAERLGDVLTSLNYNYPSVDTYTFTCTTSTGSVNVDARSTI
jgi:hypothetical protein